MLGNWLLNSARRPRSNCRSEARPAGRYASFRSLRSKMSPDPFSRTRGDFDANASRFPVSRSVCRGLAVPRPLRRMACISKAIGSRSDSSPVLALEDYARRAMGIGIVRLGAVAVERATVVSAWIGLPDGLEAVGCRGDGGVAGGDVRSDGVQGRSE